MVGIAVSGGSNECNDVDGNDEGRCTDSREDGTEGHGRNYEYKCHAVQCDCCGQCVHVALVDHVRGID